MTYSLLKYYDLYSSSCNLYQEVTQGLANTPMSLPAKLFYDARGSKLFDNICQTPEYYVTRTENTILKNNITEITQKLGDECLLIELGCGSCHKIRVLLNALKKVSYMPVDISKLHLLQSAKALALEFPQLPIYAVCLDYTHHLTLPDTAKNSRKVMFFPGSSLSNFEPGEAQQFLKMIADAVSPQGGLLIGIDLQKNINILHAAYNDAQGMTAAFNLNILQRINQELNADFKVSNFFHTAFYNTFHHRIEMHLISHQDQEVNVAGQRIHFPKAASIHTENSYKYSIDSLQALAYSVGFKLVKTWVDDKQLFSVNYFGF